MQPGLYVDAARNMRWRQLLGRSRRLIPPALLAAGARNGTVPAIQQIAAGLGADPAPQSGQTSPPHESRCFTAYGATRRFGAPAFWHDDTEGLLFLFHLHGFDRLAEYAAGPRSAAGDAFWADVVSDWIACESAPRLPAWHPFPTSNRVVAWSAALSTIDSWPPTLRGALAGELWRQARYVQRAIEHDIGGNHVLRNAKALAFAGALFPTAPFWDNAMSLLRRELATQVLDDGGHEERSTSYHRSVLHDLVEVAELAARRGGTPEPWLAKASRDMAGWQAAIAGPDSRLPLLNDAWEGPPVARATDSDVTELADSGYLVFRHDEDQAVFDAGPVGPRHLPPHTHADALSFVLWADGRPVIVDPGSYAYTGPWRRHFRSTAMHNTVEVDGMDQCELWGDFRAAYMPRVRVGPVRRDGDVIVVSAMHDGYGRLPDPVEHHRTFIWCARHGIIVIDRLRARQAHRIRSSLHAAPDAAVERQALGPFVIEPLGPDARLDTETYSYSPYLAASRSGAVITASRVVRPETPFGWSILRGDRRVDRLDRESLVITGEGEPETRVDLTWCA